MFNFRMSVRFSKNNTILLFFLILFLTSFVTFGQGGRGKIAGKVIDEATKEELIGATILIDGTNLGAATDFSGYYSILNIQPGRYTVTARMIGYGTVSQKEVDIFIDRSTKIDFKLSIATITTQTVTITAEKPKIIKDQTSSSSTLDDEQIKNIPIEGLRGALDLSSSFQKNSQGDYQVRGSGTNEVSFQVNGVEQGNSNSAVPGWGAGTKADNSWKYDVNPIGVQQLQMISGGFSAEYGNAQAGVVKVALKEGAPKFTGEVRMEYRPAGQYHWGNYIYDRSGFEWQTWGNFDYWNQKKNDAIKTPGNNIFTQLSMNSRYDTLYSKVFVTKNASPSEQARWDSLANYEINWAYQQWMRLHTPAKDHPVGVYDYTASSYQRIDFGFGGPLGRNPDLLKFFFSGQYLKKPTRLPSTEQDQVKQNYTLSLSSTIIKDHKFKFNGTFQKYVGGLFSGSDDIRWSGISPSYKYFVNRDPVRTELTISQSFNWIYTINPNTFIESMFSHQYEKYELPYRYLPTWNDLRDRLDGSNSTTGGVLLTRGDWWDQTYFTPYENIATDFFQDNRSDQYTFKTDFTSQIDKMNLVKAGFQFNYSDMANTGVTYNFKANAFLTQQGVAEHYTAFPISGSIFLQDKMEYDGMVANLGIRAEAYNFQSSTPVNMFNVFYPGTQGPGSIGDLTTEKSKTKFIFLPRLGISFPIGESTAFRMQYGHFASMPIFSQALGTSTFYGWNTRGNPNLEPKKTINYEFGIQQLLDQDNRIDVAIYYNDRVSQIGNQQVAGYTGNARNNAGFTNTNTPLFYYNSYANNSFGSTIGLEITLDKVTWGDISYRLSYSLSQTTDGNYGAPMIYPQNASSYETRINSMENLSYQDRTHNFRGLIQYNLGADGGFELLGVKPFENSIFSLTYTAQSGQPFTYRTSSDLKDVFNNRRFPIESAFDFNFTKNLVFGGTKIIFTMRVMNLFNNKWLTPPDTNDDLNRWINNGITMDIPDNPNKLSYMLNPYRAWRNVPRQIFFTLGIGI